MSLDLDHIQRTAQRLSIADSPVCVHSSLRSFGYVQGGAATVVSGLLDVGCTVLVPAFSWGFAIQPPPPMRPQRNGTDYNVSAMSAAGATRIFDRATSELDQDSMGAIPAAVLAMDGHIRGHHPLNSFAAVGPLAAEVVTGQEPLSVYQPLEALARLGGYAVLMGVGLTSMTLLHLAEQCAGRNPFRRWAKWQRWKANDGGDRRLLEWVREVRLHPRTHRASCPGRQIPLACIPCDASTRSCHRGNQDRSADYTP